MWHEIWLSTIANIISAFFIALIGLFSYIVIFVTERQKLFLFFGINHKVPHLRLYLSRLEIKPGGTIGIEQIQKGYSGPSINKIEYDGALLISKLFRSTVLAMFPRRFQDWLGQQYVNLLHVDAEINISPQQLENISFDNLVILGSSIYNLPSKYYLSHPHCKFSFEKKETGERIFRIRTSEMNGAEIPGRASNRDLAILQRINDKQHGTSVFICAGLGASATFGCTRYLAENWKALFRKYKTDEFGICLAFPSQPPDSEMVVKPIIVYEVH